MPPHCLYAALLSDPGGVLLPQATGRAYRCILCLSATFRMFTNASVLLCLGNGHLLKWTLCIFWVRRVGLKIFYYSDDLVWRQPLTELSEFVWEYIHFHPFPVLRIPFHSLTACLNSHFALLTSANEAKPGNLFEYSSHPLQFTFIFFFCMFSCMDQFNMRLCYPCAGELDLILYHLC